MMIAPKSAKKLSYMKKEKGRTKTTLTLPPLPQKRYIIIKLKDVQARKEKYTQLLMDTRNSLEFVYGIYSQMNFLLFIVSITEEL